MQSKISKRILTNGLTILALPRHAVPKVSVQLWYNVGSKDEKTSEHGIAHLIEHMIFKGTKKLSESDINLITHKLAGYTNAFTSYDYTGYMFDFPSQNWQAALMILSDCMRNCTFKQDFLDSEMQAVIQELKMYKDDYSTSIIELLTSAIFYDHPYHHPIIGYKQDLWSLSRERLVDFYRKHYIPNNAALVVVGDIEPDLVFEKAEKFFGKIKPHLDYKKESFYHSYDLRCQTVTIYRDVQQPLIVLTWVVPGSQVGKDYVIDIASWIIGSGRGSRLQKKLVDELQLVTELETFSYDLFEYGLFFIYFQPVRLADLDRIVGIIQAELNDLSQSGPKEAELIRATKKTEVEHLALLESNQKQAYAIGKYYLALGNENYFLTYTDYPKQNLGNEIKELMASYFRPAIMHLGKILPVETADKSYWLLLQDISDKEDTKILSGKFRKTEVELGKAVFNVHPKKPKPFAFPLSDSFTLSNGLKVLYHHNPELPKIDLILDFKAKYFYDPEHLQGLCSFTSDMLLEGTQNYSATLFADTLESYGMTFNCYPGHITLSMLSKDFSKGIEFLTEVVSQATLDQAAVEKVRAQKIAAVKSYWDNPPQFSSQLLRQKVYREHPYHKAEIGDLQSIGYITHEDLVNYYKKYITPRDSRLVLVGDIKSTDFDKLDKFLDSWQGQAVEDLTFPKLDQLSAHEINYPIARDQVVLCYGGLSVSRLDPDYDKLFLFDQIFTGGVLGSMSSRLFDLRESTGLFYTIGGSLISKITKQPGMIAIKTVVSNDRLQEAEKAIETVIDTAIDTVSELEFTEAKNAVINSLVDNFSSNHQTALTLLFQDLYNFPENFFYNRAEQLASIKLEETQRVVKKWLSTDKLVKLRIGRIS